MQQLLDWQQRLELEFQSQMMEFGHSMTGKLQIAAFAIVIVVAVICNVPTKWLKRFWD